MGNEISQQLTSFLASGLLGAVLGLLYDLLRSFRQAVRGRGVSLFDGLYSLFAFAAVFYFTMTFGEGELRLYMLAGIFGGLVLFFSLLSAPLRPVWDFWRGCVEEWVRLCLLPVGLTLRAGEKIGKRTKKHFLFFRKWFTIITTKWRVV